MWRCIGRCLRIDRAVLVIGTWRNIIVWQLKVCNVGTCNYVLFVPVYLAYVFTFILLFVRNYIG